MPKPIDLNSRRPGNRPGGRGPNLAPPTALCQPPKPFFFLFDPLCSLAWYDAEGRPKRYAPSAQMPNGEWSYSLSPRRNDGPLRNEELAAHLDLCALRPAQLPE